LTIPSTYILAAGEDNSSLLSLSIDSSLLDWQIRTFKKCISTNDPFVVVGHNFVQIRDRFPRLNFLHAYDHKNALQSFLSVQQKVPTDCISMYGDTLFKSDTITQLLESEGDCVVVIDSEWRHRFQGRTRQDSSIAEVIKLDDRREVEFTGLVKMSAKVIEWLKVFNRNSSKTINFIEAFCEIEKAGFLVNYLDVFGDWTEMNQSEDLAHFIMGTKAETLERLRDVLSESQVCDQVTFTANDWKSNQLEIVDEIQSLFLQKKIIIRSSSKLEDSWASSNAGAFESVLDVDSSIASKIIDAIDFVISFYNNEDLTSQILVQNFIEDIEISGVVFTCDLTTGAPYYVVNYDDTSGRSDTITSGSTDEVRTVVALKSSVENVLKIDPRISDVLNAVHEIEYVLGYDRLDIEFAVNHSGAIFTFQVRPIVTNNPSPVSELDAISDAINEAKNDFKKWQTPAPQILGENTFFSSMTDWNPAEIIGYNPSDLAVSLYRHLITEKNWATQRCQYGYRDVRPAPLVHMFCGHPYIDCRASINSLIPADLPEILALKLVSIYMSKLINEPHLHDKVELEVVFTIWTQNFKEEFKQRFPNHDLSNHDLEILELSLKNLTTKAFTRLNSDISSIETLMARFEKVRDSECSSIQKIYQLIEDCRMYGTLAFAHAARAGFVSITFLNSLVKQKILTETRMLEFQRSVPTVTSEFQEDLVHECNTTQDLINRYGHLRPGTYDINQIAYWENPSFYFKRPKLKQSVNQKFEFSDVEMVGIKDVIGDLSKTLVTDEVIQFLVAGIQAREKVKFKFSRNISLALDLLGSYGKVIGLSREQISFLSFSDIAKVRVGELVEKDLLELIKQRKKSSFKQKVKLPNFISFEGDFTAFEIAKMLPNFVTAKTVTAELLLLTADNHELIDKTIVVIENADPGFDWIFSYDIAGLITRYGGANSHMAIRCAELNIPAAIGVGDLLFEEFKSGLAQLDCSRGVIEHV